MDSILALLITGFVVGTLGTLIGAGGGFILIPILLFTHPALSPDVVTAISIAIVAANAISGSVAYGRSGRIDFRAGLLFAVCTIPGSILGVFTTSFIPKELFQTIFGILLLALSIFLFFGKKKGPEPVPTAPDDAGVLRHLTDMSGTTYRYKYNAPLGILVSVIVGYISPLLGIGGGIIHVPALINWLNFPVHVATATSHFILAVMATVSVITHWVQGSYHDPLVQRMVLFLAVGAIVGAQWGAILSHKVKGNVIVRSLAVCLAIVGVRILLSS